MFNLEISVSQIKLKGDIPKSIEKIIRSRKRRRRIREEFLSFNPVFNAIIYFQKKKKKKKIQESKQIDKEQEKKRERNKRVIKTSRNV